MNEDLKLKTKLFINGEFVSSKGGNRLEVYNPADGKVFHAVETGSKEDVDLACKYAKTALKIWSKTTGKERAEFLEKIATEILKRKERLSLIETLDNGKPLKESIMDINDSASCFLYYAKLARGMDSRQGEVVDVENNDYEVKLYHEPVGVCALIIPFNYPLLMASWKVAPALAAGCTIILKPSEVF